MSTLDVFMNAAGNVATVLTLCFAHPVERGCVTKWVAPGRHLTECRILTATVKAQEGDRLQCAVVPMDRERAQSLFDIHGVCP